MTYLYLCIAVACEVIGTSAMQASQQFTRAGPTALMIVGYIGAFYFLALTLRVLPVGIAYGIWSGLGIVLISAIGYVIFGQRLDLPALLGLAFIIVGVVIINLFSESLTH